MSISKEKLTHIANALELLQNTLKCVICLEMLRDPVSTRCGHHFCTLCLNNLFNLRKNARVTCPLCSAVINRRGIIESDKIKRHVDGVTRLLKAIASDSAMDITLLRQSRSSSFEANSSVAGPSTSRNQSQIEVVLSENVDPVNIEDSTTPKRSPPPKLSSAEKVKTWLIQNDNDFESKTILNEFSIASKPIPCDEDSDNEMISVSQVVPTTNTSSVKEHSDTVKNDVRPTTRRCLKIKEINLLTSANIAKSTDDAFDKLLQNSHKDSSPKSEDKSTVSKGAEISVEKNNMSTCTNKSKSPSRENIFPGSPVLLELMEPRGPSNSPTSKSNTPPTLLDKDNREHFFPDKEMPQLEPMLTVKNTAHPSKKTTSSESQTTSLSCMDSCEIIPPSICDGDVLDTNLKQTDKITDVVIKSKKTMSELSNVEIQAAMKNMTNQKVKTQHTKRRSSVVGNASLKVSHSAVSKRYNVSFFQCGRVIRERRFLPVDIRCHCVDKPMFLLDLNDPSPQHPSVPPSPKKSLLVPEKELLNVGSQTSPMKPSAAPTAGNDTATRTATDTPAADSESEDMFPISPENIVESGGIITKQRSNNSSIVSDGILDAATVLFTQPPIARSLTYHDMDNTLLEPEKSALKSRSKSLLSKKNEEPPKEPSVKSDSDEELVGIRKSSKRPQRLSSSDDSEFGGEKIGRKKIKKTSPFSRSGRDSAEFMQKEVPVPLSLFDQTLESPQRLVQGIKAKIAAGMLNTMDDVPCRTSHRASSRASPRASSRAGSRTSPRASPRVQRASRQASKLADIDLTTPPRKKSSSDSDVSDFELLEGTPQQQTSINISRRSLKSAEESFSAKAVNTTLTHTESCTPGFVEPSQPPFNDLPPSFDSKKSEVKTSGRTSTEKDVASPASKRRRADKCPTPQRPLREKNTTEERASNTSLNNSSTKESRLQEKKKDATPQPVQKLQPSKIQTPKKVDQKLCFVCSGLAGNFTALVHKFAASVGADFSSKFDAKATHLIVKTKDDNTTDKTLKYLCAVAAKKWVVSFQWVVEGLKEGKLLPEEKFEVLDTTGAEGPRLSRISSKLLFSGFEFCIFPPLSDITKQQLEELVLMCGAVVVSDPKKFSFRPDVLPLCLAEYDEEREQDYVGWIDRYCVPLVQHEWILDCIGRFSLVSFWSLLMSDVSDDNLRSMGYPPHLIEHPPSDSTEME